MKNLVYILIGALIAFAMMFIVLALSGRTSTSSIDDINGYSKKVSGLKVVEVETDSQAEVSAIIC